MQHVGVSSPNRGQNHLLTEKRLTDLENKFMVVRGKDGGKR